MLFEEIPLYARESDIAFLSGFNTEKKNEILLKFSLNYLKSVISYQLHNNRFFAAITAWDYSDGDPIVPNLFVWNKSSEELHDRLHLNKVATAFGRKMVRMVSASTILESFDVLEDSSTASDMVRVFIGPSLPAYKSFVLLSTFLNTFSLSDIETVKGLVARVGEHNLKNLIDVVK